MLAELPFRFESPVERVFGLVQSFRLQMDVDGDDGELKALEVRVQAFRRGSTDGVLQFRVEPRIGRGIFWTGPDLIVAEIKALVVGVS